MAHKTLGDALLANGYRKTVWVSYDNINRHEFGLFVPSAPLLDFQNRYGCAKRKGDLVGERYARYKVEEVIRHPSNPFGIENNQEYVLRDGEEYDLKMVTAGGSLVVYDSFFVPRYDALFPARKPTTPRPTTVPAPPAPTTPPPNVPPAPVPQATPETQRVEELRTMLREAVVGFRSAADKPGIIRFIASPFAGLVLLRAVQVFRKVMSK